MGVLDPDLAAILADLEKLAPADVVRIEIGVDTLRGLLDDGEIVPDDVTGQPVLVMSTIVRCIEAEFTSPPTVGMPCTVTRPNKVREGFKLREVRRDIENQGMLRLTLARA